MPSGIVTAAVICIIILGILVVLQMVAITALMFVIKNLAQQLVEHVDPLLAKVNSILVTANEMAQTVQGKTEHIAEKTAQTSDVVADRVEKTSGLLQGAIATPIITGAAMAEGVGKGFRAWRAAREKRKADQGKINDL